MKSNLLLVVKFKELYKKFGWAAATGIMCAFLVYQVRKDQQNQPPPQNEKKNQISNDGTNCNFGEDTTKSGLTSDGSNQQKQLEERKKSEKIQQNHNNNIQNKNSHLNSHHSLSKYRNQSNQSSSRDLSDDDHEKIIYSLKKPTNRSEILKQSKSMMQQNFLKKSRVQHFDEEEYGNQIFSDIDNRQSHFLKHKFDGDMDGRSRQFASDQDEESLNQYQKNQLKRIIKEQQSDQDRIFFQIYGGLIIDEKEEREEDFD